VQVQQLLQAGESREVQPLFEVGRHGVRAIGAPGGPALEVAVDGAVEATLTLAEDGWTAPAGPLSSAPRLRLVNATGVERLFAIERTAWADDSVTAAAVTANPEFRDLFASEVLGAGEFMSVGSLSVLFTDLKGSTRLYRSVGDAPAFGRVMRHFEILEEAVEREGGTIVKTIGDAVMAVFVRAVDAVRAVLEAQRALGEAEQPLTLKAGVHHGPCMVVTLNERLDYFGTTVNVAARLGALSAGDDVVLSDEVRNADGMQELVDTRGVSVESLSAELRGLEGRVTVWRVSAGRQAGA
jgi:class 3 adenylate cyclase